MDENYYEDVGCMAAYLATDETHTEFHKVSSKPSAIVRAIYSHVLVTERHLRHYLQRRRR